MLSYVLGASLHSQPARVELTLGLNITVFNAWCHFAQDVFFITINGIVLQASVFLLRPSLSAVCIAINTAS